MNRVPLVWLVAGAEASDLAAPLPSPEPGEDYGQYAARALVIVGVGLLAELARAGVQWAVAELRRLAERRAAGRARVLRDAADRRQPVRDDAP